MNSAQVRGAFKNYAEMLCNIKTGGLFSIKLLPIYSNYSHKFQPNMIKIPYSPSSYDSCLSHKEWLSGAKPDFINDKIKFAYPIILVLKDTDYRNQTSRNKTILFFKSILTGKASTIMTINTIDTFKGLFISWLLQWHNNVMRRFWPQFGHHSEMHLTNRLLAVTNSFISILLCLQVNICSYNAVFVQTSPLEMLYFMPKVQLN